MSANHKLSISNIILRYFLLLVLILILSYDFIYPFFLLITILPVSALLSFFYNTLQVENLIIAGDKIIQIIPGCVAVSAYILLFSLNLSTPMNAKQRIYSLFFSFGSLLIINILRIFIFSILFINSYVYFDILHKFFWYFLSVIFIVIIWFLTVYLFKIKDIPIYGDFKFIIKQTKFRK